MKSQFDPKQIKVIVTAGPTREWIDPVRFISNPSSGKTGYELAKKSLIYFKEVVYIHGPVCQKYREIANTKNIPVTTTQDMAEAVFKELENHTMLIMSAAPADYKIRNISNEKIKKKAENILIELEPTIDILSTIGNSLLKNYEKLILVGFAAETHNLEQYAKEKLIKKNIHFICGNYVYKDQNGFGNVKNEIQIFDKWNEQKKIPLANKEEIAEKILDFLIHKTAEVWNKL